MEIVVKIIATGDLQKVKLQNGNEMSKIDVEMESGSNQIIATAFDKVALELANDRPVVNAIYILDFNLTCSKTEKRFLNARINHLTPLF